ncbi:MAG: hypothetical protein R3F48_13915 [Candidatus Zixiibacteriota bacterium]
MSKYFRISVFSLILALALIGLSQTALSSTGGKFFDTNSTKSNSATWKFAFRAGGLYSFNNYEAFAYNVDNGAGFDADALYAIDNHHSLRFSFGKSGLKLVNNDYRTLGPATKPTTSPLPPYMHIYNQKDELSVSRAFLSLQFNTALRNTNANNGMLYGLGGIGLIFNDVKQSYDIFNDSTLETSHYSYNANDTRIAFQFGAGATYLLFRNIGVDASALAIISSSKDTGDVALQAPNYGTYFDVRFGLVVVF